MKEYYALITKLMNGTVVMKTSVSIFETEDLANKVANKLKEINAKDISFDVIYTIEKVPFFNNENDVPILNTTK